MCTAAVLDAEVAAYLPWSQSYMLKHTPGRAGLIVEAGLDRAPQCMGALPIHFEPKGVEWCFDQ
jgi:hypothetical protein